MNPPSLVISKRFNSGDLLAMGYRNKLRAVPPIDSNSNPPYVFNHCFIPLLFSLRIKISLLPCRGLFHSSEYDSPIIRYPPSGVCLIILGCSSAVPPKIYFH